MPNEKITLSQMVSLFFLMILGSSIIIGMATDAKQDSWMAVLFAMLGSLPFLLMYARLAKLFPDKVFCDAVTTATGKLVGIVAIVIHVWYVLHLGGLVMRNVSEFVQTVSMPETDQYVPMIFLTLLSIWTARSGIESMGRCALYGVPTVILIVVITTLAGISDMKSDHFFPVFGAGIGKIADAAWSTLAFPFLETLLLGTQLYTLKKGHSKYKSVIYGVVMGGLVLTLVTLRNTLILGPALQQKTYYSSFEASGIPRIGVFFTRFEALITSNMILATFMKSAICLLVASKGVAYLAGIKDYRDIVAPVGLLMLTFSFINNKTIAEMYELNQVYRYYVIPYQIILPILIWIMAEIKAKKLKKQGALAGQAEQQGKEQAEQSNPAGQSNPALES